MTPKHLINYSLAGLMLENEQHVISVELLFDDQQIGSFVKSVQIDSPYQQLLLEGVLTESVKDEHLCVGFMVEGNFHFVLGEVIFKLAEGSMRHEGAMGYLESMDMVLNWAGTIPSPEFGKEPTLVRQLSCWKLSEKDGFKNLEFGGDEPPLTGGYFQKLPGNNELLYIHPENIWKLTVYER